jgi:hypothetical protein
MIRILIGVLFIAGCSQFHYMMKTSSYSFERVANKTLGYVNKSYRLYPILKLDDGFYIKIQPYTSYELSDHFCIKGSDTFTFLIWSNRELIIDPNDSKFYSENTNIGITKVTDLNYGGAVEPWLIQANLDYDIDLESSWRNGEFESLGLYKKKHFYKVLFESSLGCPTSKYQLDLSWTYSDSSLKMTKTLYFYPIEYEAVSR